MKRETTRNKRLLVLLGVIALALVGTTTASATAIDFVYPTVDFTDDTYSLGFKFRAYQSYTVRYLGFYDDLQNGLTESHAVGIYAEGDVLGPPLVSGTVSPGAPLSGWFRWVAVTPTTLVAGQIYRIAAVTGSENYTWNPNGFTTDPAIIYQNSQRTQSATLVYPDGSDSSRGYFGPNFSAVPEPGTLLLLGTGLAGLALRRRRQ